MSNKRGYNITWSAKEGSNSYYDKLIAILWRLSVVIVATFAVVWLFEDQISSGTVERISMVSLVYVAFGLVAFLDVFCPLIVDRLKLSDMYRRILYIEAYTWVLLSYAWHIRLTVENDEKIVIRGVKYIQIHFFKYYDRHFGTDTYFKPGSAIGMGILMTMVFTAFVILTYMAHKFLVHKWILLITPIGILFAGMYVGLAPSWKSVLLLTVLVAMLFTKRPNMVGVGAFALVLLITGVLASGAAEGIVSHSREVKIFQKKLEQWIDSLGGGNGVSLAIEDKQTVDNEKPKYYDDEIFRVGSEEKPKTNLYYKTFQADEYENGIWVSSSVSFDKAYENRYDDREKEREYIAETAYETLKKSVLPAGSVAYDNKYALRMLKDNYETVMTPYFTDFGGFNEELYGDTLIKNKNNRKLYGYTGFAGNILTEGDIDAIINYEILTGRPYSSKKDQFFRWYDNYVDNHYTENEEEFEIVKNIAGEIKALAYDSQAIPERELRKNDTPLGWRYRMANLVAFYLSQNYTYSQNLAKTDGDAVEYFLETGKKGYCTHFASAGVMILRELGVPARYVSGFVVLNSEFELGTKSDHLDDEFGTKIYYHTTVTDYNAHAWVEIYIDGYGWIPVDMTPGYNDTARELPTKGNGNKVDEPTRTPTPTKNVTNTPKPTKAPTKKPAHSPSTAPLTITGKPNGGNGSTVVDKKSGMIALVVVGGAACALVLGFIILRISTANSRAISKKIRDKRYRDAVKKTNRVVYKKLMRKGAFNSEIKANIKDEEYKRLLKKYFSEGVESEDEWDEFIEIVSKASFSEEPISRDEAIFVRSIYKTLKGKKKNG